MLTAEQHAKLMVGDLLFTIAQLKAELDTRPPAPPPSPSPENAPAPVPTDGPGPSEESR